MISVTVLFKRREGGWKSNLSRKKVALEKIKEELGNNR
jgi:hypothetical protein